MAKNEHGAKLDIFKITEVEVGAVHTIGHHIRPCPGSWNTEMTEDPALCIMRTDVHKRVTRYGMRANW